MTALFTQIKLNINGLLDTGADEAEAVLFWWFDLNMQQQQQSLVCSVCDEIIWCNQEISTLSIRPGSESRVAGESEQWRPSPVTALSLARPGHTVKKLSSRWVIKVSLIPHSIRSNSLTRPILLIHKKPVNPGLESLFHSLLHKSFSNK